MLAVKDQERGVKECSNLLSHKNWKLNSNEVFQCQIGPVVNQFSV